MTVQNQGHSDCLTSVILYSCSCTKYASRQDYVI